MNITPTQLAGVVILEPTVFGDSRGWFMESYSHAKLQSAGHDYNWVQDNHSYSEQQGVLRGIHCQVGEHAQAKLVRVTRGAVLDVAVCFKTKQWVAVELSAENKKQLLIPRGYGHGFVTLTDRVEFLYKTDNYYNKEADRSVKWNDPTLGIDWGTAAPILSEKDTNAPLLVDAGVI